MHFILFYLGKIICYRYLKYEYKILKLDMFYLYNFLNISKQIIPSFSIRFIFSRTKRLFNLSLITKKVMTVKIENSISLMLFLPTNLPVPETSDITAEQPIAKNIKLQKYKY